MQIHNVSTFRPKQCWYHTGLLNPMRIDMTLFPARHRFLLFLIVPVFLIALSSCGSSSVEDPDIGQEINSGNTDADADSQESVTDQENTEPQITEPEVTEPEATDPEVTAPEVTEPDSNEQNGTDVSNAIDQPNILLVITDDQGIDASAQYSLSNDLPKTAVW